MPQQSRQRSVTTYYKPPVGDNKFYRRTFYSAKWKVNKPEWPKHLAELPYDMSYAESSPAMILFQDSDKLSGYQSDAPNDAPYPFMHREWSSSLYSRAYTDAAQAARAGSTQWASNIVEMKKTWNMFVHWTALSCAVAMSAAHRFPVGRKVLAREPHLTAKGVRKRISYYQRQLLKAKREEWRKRRRYKARVFAYQEALGMLLAIRYGLMPLMSDISEAHRLLTSDQKQEATVRVSRSETWKWGNYPALSMRRTASGPGSESITIKLTATVTNPNLLLANQLGLVNPASVIWETTKYSFIVDWFVNVSGFIDNFTSHLGLSYKNTSVTRTRRVQGDCHVQYPGRGLYWFMAGRAYKYVRKQRTIGSLSLTIPKTISFGKGLSAQRTQNSLAIVGQLLTKKA